MANVRVRIMYSVRTKFELSSIVLGCFSFRISDIIRISASEII